MVKFTSQKRENAKRENRLRVFNFTVKFQKREFKIRKKFTSWSKVKWKREININGKALADPNLLALAYVISLLEGKNPAEFAFEENDIMIDHLNKFNKGRFSTSSLIQNVSSLKSVKYLEQRFMD